MKVRSFFGGGFFFTYLAAMRSEAFILFSSSSSSSSSSSLERIFERYSCFFIPLPRHFEYIYIQMALIFFKAE